MGSRPTPDFAGLIGRLAAELETRRIPFMLIGGQAVLLHGEPRLTHDVDVIMGVGPDRVQDLLDACEALGLDPLPDEPRAFARETFVLPAADPDTKIRVDLIFSTTPYEAQAIERAVLIDMGTRRVPFATAEDLLLHKLFAGRPRDIEDETRSSAKSLSLLELANSVTTERSGRPAAPAKPPCAQRKAWYELVCLWVGAARPRLLRQGSSE